MGLKSVLSADTGILFFIDNVWVGVDVVCSMCCVCSKLIVAWSFV